MVSVGAVWGDREVEVERLEEKGKKKKNAPIVD